MKLFFHINFNTQFGEKLQLVMIENHQAVKTYDLKYENHGWWTAEIDYFSKTLSYKYQVVTDQDEVVHEEYSLHELTLAHSYDEFEIYDVWNNKNYPENYLNNKILKNKLGNFKAEKVSLLKKHTHHFRIEAPLYHPNWRVVLLGSSEALGNWEYLKTIPLYQTDYGVWEAGVTIPDSNLIYYKYGIMDTVSGDVIDVEYGDNRWVYPNSEDEILMVKSDHYFRFKSWELYHAAGVAVPVFALRSQSGFGVGEFQDMKLLADWSHQTNLGIIQILPINDTTANYSWTDSYPYAAISVYALHPQYISLEKLDFEIPKATLEAYQKEKEALNSLEVIDYEKMISGKWKFIQAVFDANKVQILKDKNFKKFQKEQEAWLLPYSAFCVLRDKYNTPNFNDWKTHKKYIAGKVSAIFAPKSKDYETAMMHSWVQYQLHLQLKEAIDYAHGLGVSVKGDLPIGIYRYSVEAWTEPELFGMDFQAGAPPDQFTDLGQNWGFPTYNWEAMKQDGYQWWKNRFKALEQYFDAMRIDHILGFFRIWRMPFAATQGILGYFYPAIPVTINEFKQKGISFDYDRFCTPFINDQILWNLFGEEKNPIADYYLNAKGDGTYSFKEGFNTQRRLSEHFEVNPHWASEKLISLAANVLFLTEDRDGEQVYHPRFNINKTESYKFLPISVQNELYAIYLDYFFKRQDEMWAKSAMEKLPMILNSTDMLICGEDLGLVPDCVPMVMDQLAITALKVQRMPSENILWYDPKDASYMNVVTASSHDSSTLRQWWQEDRDLSVKYFKDQLHQHGTAPWSLEPQLAEVIMKQHLFNDAMLAIFPIQEFLATESYLTHPKQDLERINNPAVFPHYWRYRMHLNLEDLVDQKEFNTKIGQWVSDSGRK